MPGVVYLDEYRRLHGYWDNTRPRHSRKIGEMGRLSWRRREHEFWASSTAIVRGHSAEAVWSLIISPDVAHLIDPDVVRAYIFPGTGPGVGEVQSFATATPDGRTNTVNLRVTGYDPPRRAETVVLDVRPRTGGLYELEGVTEGTLLRYSAWVDLPRRRRAEAAQQLTVLQAHTDQFVLAVKRHAEGSLE